MQIERYNWLPPFPDAAPGLASIKRAGHLLAALSNGEAEMIRSVLANAGLLALFDDVVSADEVKTFKPDPTIYSHAVQLLGQTANDTWLVSSNPFDVIGAKPATLAIRVTVREAFFHCAKAFIRSQLWKPETWPERYAISFGRYMGPKLGLDENGPSIHGFYLHREKPLHWSWWFRILVSSRACSNPRDLGP